MRWTASATAAKLAGVGPFHSSEGLLPGGLDITKRVVTPGAPVVPAHAGDALPKDVEAPIFTAGKQVSGKAAGSG